MDWTGICGFGSVISAFLKGYSSIPKMSSFLCWALDSLLSSFGISLTACRGYTRLTATMQCMQQLRKIKLTLGVQNRYLTEENRRLKMYVAFMFALGVAVMSSNNRLINHGGFSFKGSILTCCYEYICVLLILQGTQFTFCVYEIITVLKTLNDSLDKMRYLKRQEIFVVGHNLIKSISKSLEVMTHCYDEICTVIRKLERASSVTLIFMLGVLTMRFVIKPFLIVRNFFTSDIEATDSTLVLSYWMVMYFLGILMVLEPCHITQAEAKRTGVILSMLANMFTDTNISRKLFNFSRYIGLNEVRYCPMGICLLSRSLLNTILGSSFTYLIIIIQFQSYE
ncbi:unnamed protein product [Chilo suppressalis]|uniref:Gustatory receptor n=1 Tax=Chilo suppressalis TaxID=168631 RepID=A0ABN8B184_CHISP|nr:unnamed protein product [Chilo suppressalis]